MTDRSPLLVISAVDARRLLLHAQALLEDPTSRGPATSRSVASLVEQMGFVQIDTISTVERAHHLIIAPRFHEYRPAMLKGALEQNRRLFEHWTHDASIIPLKWYPHWRPRFEKYKAGTWHRKHLGADADQILAAVLQRITAEGPLASRDFEHLGERKQNTWWGWKPQKIALDYLWRCGVLHVTARRSFHKVYDLTERVIPKHAALPRPEQSNHVDWACQTALERLGIAAVREIAQFWAAISMQDVKPWLKQNISSGKVIPVMVESADGSPPVLSYTMADVRKRIARLPEAPTGMRLLCPFDPVLRDRQRAKRLFNFDFRFEGFVPAAQRKHGYYVMAIFHNEQFVGKADPKFDRASKTLRIGKVWWEPNLRVTQKIRATFENAVEQLAGWIGADRVDIQKP